MGQRRAVSKEYYRVKQNHPYFNGFFTREKLILMIELLENEGWTYLGDKDILRIGSFGSGLGDSDSHHSPVVAVFERIARPS